MNKAVFKFVVLRRRCRKIVSICSDDIEQVDFCMFAFVTVESRHKYCAYKKYLLFSPLV